MKKIFLFKLFAMTLIVFISIAFAAGAEKGEENKEREMEIKGIGFDQKVQSPVVLLTDKEQNTVLPIWIGLCEARSIELGIAEQVAPRPPHL